MIKSIAKKNRLMMKLLFIATITATNVIIVTMIMVSMMDSLSHLF